MTSDQPKQIDYAVMEALRTYGAVKTGHFQLSSGLHSDTYVQCASVLQHPAQAEVIGSALSRLVASFEPKVVASPALGGVIIGQEVARALKVRHVFLERREGQMQLRRGFTFEPGESVCIVEDVVTTGKSQLETANAILENGGNPAVIASIVDRTVAPPPFVGPFVALVRLEARAFDQAQCPMCQAGEPLNSPGSRHANSSPR